MATMKYRKGDVFKALHQCVVYGISLEKDACLTLGTINSFRDCYACKRDDTNFRFEMIDEHLDVAIEEESIQLVSKSPEKNMTKCKDQRLEDIIL